MFTFHRRPQRGGLLMGWGQGSRGVFVLPWWNGRSYILLSKVRSKKFAKWRCLCIGNHDGKILKNCWRLWSVRHGSSFDFFQLPFLLLRVLLKKSCNLLDVWTFPGWILGRGYNWKIRRRRKGRWVRRLRRRNRMTRSRWRCLWSSQADGFRY